MGFYHEIGRVFVVECEELEKPVRLIFKIKEAYIFALILQLRSLVPTTVQKVSVLAWHSRRHFSSCHVIASIKH